MTKKQFKDIIFKVLEEAELDSGEKIKATNEVNLSIIFCNKFNYCEAYRIINNTLIKLQRNTLISVYDYINELGEYAEDFEPWELDHKKEEMWDLSDLEEYKYSEIIKDFIYEVENEQEQEYILKAVLV